jgi:hypothetical protein
MMTIEIAASNFFIPQPYSPLHLGQLFNGFATKRLVVVYIYLEADSDIGDKLEH